MLPLLSLLPYRFPRHSFFLKPMQYTDPELTELENIAEPLLIADGHSIERKFSFSLLTTGGAV